MCSSGFCFGGWWIIPVLMMLFCFIMCFVFFRRWNFGMGCCDYPGRQPGQKNSDTPIGLLKKRYANGEITSEEYERIKRSLED